jgi:hypothetical protein
MKGRWRREGESEEEGEGRESTGVENRDLIKVKKKRYSLQEKKKLRLLSDVRDSESVRAAGRLGPEAPTMCTNSSYVTEFVFR